MKNSKHAANLVLPNGKRVNMKIKDAVVIKAALKEASEALRKTANTLDDFVFEASLNDTEKL